MKGFVRAELMARRRALTGLSLGALLLLMIVGLSYVSLGRGALVTAFHGRSPRALSAMSGAPGTDVLSPHGWMALGFNHPMVLILTLTVAVMIGTGAIAGEVESGRAELTFTAPIPRTRFLYSSLLVWMVAEIVVICAGAAGALIGAAFSHDIRDSGLAVLLQAPLQLVPLTFFIATFAFLASAAAGSRGRAMGAAIGVGVFGYLLNLISGLIGSLSWLHWLSPFGYYNPAAAIDHGLRWAPAGELVAAGLLLLTGARWVLLKRDLA
jgi:ABC-2 type transport system permease protein